MMNILRPDTARSVKLLLSIGFLLLLLLLPGVALADSAVDDAIRALLLRDNAAHADVDVQVFPGSAKLPECLQPQAFYPPTAGQRRWGRMSVGVRCLESGSERYYQVQVNVSGYYPVVTTAVEAGDRLGEDNMEWRQGDLSRLPPGAILQASKLKGQVARHRLSPGQVLQQQHLHTPPLVARGERLTLISQGTGFRITREAEALNDGALGDTVRVRLSRQQVMEAIITGPGQAKPRQ